MTNKSKMQDVLKEGKIPYLKSVVLLTAEQDLIERDVWSPSYFTSIVEEKDFLHKCCSISPDMLEGAVKQLADIMSAVYWHLAFDEESQETLCPKAESLFSDLRAECEALCTTFGVQMADEVKKLLEKPQK